MHDQTIEAALTRHTRDLMSLPGVVGTAQGECAGQPCIKVYVVEPRADALSHIPTHLEGYPVVIEATGDIGARDSC